MVTAICCLQRPTAGGAETERVSAVDTAILLEVHGVRLLVCMCWDLRVTAGEKGIIGLLEEPESDFSKNLGVHRN